MGKYEVGVLGSFDGKIGTVVGARWKGIEYMRHKGRKSKKPRSAAQLEQQAKFGCIARFVNKFTDLLMACYADTPEQTAINRAFSDIYANAVIGSYPAFDLDYSKVPISDGSLHNVNGPAAGATGGGIIRFTWNDNTGGIKAKATDKAVLAVYCPELNQAIYTISGAERSATTDNLNVMNFTGKEVETWISFLSANGKFAAPSIYTGRITVT